MTKLNSNLGTDRISTQRIGGIIDEIVSKEGRRRAKLERKWYENNFFDDGFHFRFVSAETGKIIDQQYGNLSLRTIPKASRQIRGVINLLVSPKYVPIVKPKKILATAYQTIEEYMAEYEKANEEAKKKSIWLQKEWTNLDLFMKLTEAMILAAKHSVAFIQVYPILETNEIGAVVLDAFDVYLESGISNLSDSPFIVKTIRKPIIEIKSNPYFDKEQLELISPDNKYASSEIKNAYMSSRYGNITESEYSATLIQKEAFIKEAITEFNRVKIHNDLKEYGAKAEKRGYAIRHVFSAGGLTLYDRYLPFSDYPIVDFRFEPGPIYQVPFIERFIPANKTLDLIVSRIEAYANTMVTGIYQKRKGENFRISNIPGGQIIEYETTPLQQMPIAGIPPFLFNFLQFLEKFIEEQGASTAALGQLPEGVRSGVAIESLKATEYANLQIATEMLKRTIKNLSKKIIELASIYYLESKTIENVEEKGKISFFDIIGEAGAEANKKAGYEDIIKNMVTINEDTEVEIDIESGLGYTMDGKKQSMQQILNYFIQLANAGLVSQEVIKLMIRKLVEVYQLGSTQEFMEAMDKGLQATPLTNDQIMQMKVAMAEVLKDTGIAGQQQEEKQVQATKVGMLETLKDLQGGGQQNI